MKHFTVVIIALLIPATALAAGECRKDGISFVGVRPTFALASMRTRLS